MTQFQLKGVLVHAQPDNQLQAYGAVLTGGVVPVCAGALNPAAPELLVALYTPHASDMMLDSWSSNNSTSSSSRLKPDNKNMGKQTPVKQETQHHTRSCRIYTEESRRCIASFY